MENALTLDLAQFSGGTTNWYGHPLVRKVTYTDGAKYVFETANAYWLLDKIATEAVMLPALKDQPFQVWTLKVLPTATITVDDGNGRILARTELDYTDFPDEGVTLWFSDNVILLPSEY